jgi:hypothetical protein
VYVDPENAFHTLRMQFPNVLIDVGGAKGYIDKVNAKISSEQYLRKSHWVNLVVSTINAIAEEQVVQQCGDLDLVAGIAAELNTATDADEPVQGDQITDNDEDDPEMSALHNSDADDLDDDDEEEAVKVQTLEGVQYVVQEEQLA